MVRTKSRPAADTSHDGLTDDTAKPERAPIEQPERQFLPALELVLIDESVHNPRRHYDARALQELADTIRDRGMDEPVTVRAKDDGRYELAAGHRRCRAAQMVGLAVVPAMLRVLNDAQFIELLHVNNLQREDVDPLDEAESYSKLLETGYTAEALAAKFGRLPSYIATRLKLLQLSHAARHALQMDLVPLTHSLELAKLPPHQQDEALGRMFGLNAQKLADAYAAENAPPATAEDEAEIAAADDIDDSEAETAHRFGRTHWQAPTIPPIDNLKAFIRGQMLRRLDVVPWALDDATLVPSAGACSACPKRSSTEPLLFGDLARADSCLDTACYKKKELAHGRRAQRAAATTHDDDLGPPDQPRADAKAEAATAQQQQQRRVAEERAKKRELAEFERAKARRRALLRAIVRAIRPEALTDPKVIGSLVKGVLEDRLWGDTTDADGLVAILDACGLDTTCPEGADPDDIDWCVDRLLAAIHAPKTPRATVAAIVLLAIDTQLELTVTVARMRQQPPHLTALAKALKVDMARVVKDAERAQLPVKKAVKKTPAKKAAKKVVKKPAKR